MPPNIVQKFIHKCWIHMKKLKINFLTTVPICGAPLNTFIMCDKMMEYIANAIKYTDTSRWPILISKFYLYILMNVCAEVRHSNGIGYEMKRLSLNGFLFVIIPWMTMKPLDCYYLFSSPAKSKCKWIMRYFL